MKMFVLPLTILAIGLGGCGIEGTSGNDAQGLPLGTNFRLSGVSKDLEQRRTKLASLRAELKTESSRLDQCQSILRGMIDGVAQSAQQNSMSEQARRCEAIANRIAFLKSQISTNETRIKDLEKQYAELSQLVTGSKLDGQKKKLTSQIAKRDALKSREDALEKNFTDWKCLEKLSGKFIYTAEMSTASRHAKIMQCSVLRTQLDQLGVDLSKIEKEIQVTEKAIQEILLGADATATKPSSAPAPVAQKPVTPPAPVGQKPATPAAPIEQSAKGCFWVHAGSAPLYSAASLTSQTLTPTQGAGKGKQGYVMGGGTMLYVHAEVGTFLRVTVKQGTYLGREGYVAKSNTLDLVKTSCP